MKELGFCVMVVALVAGPAHGAGDRRAPDHAKEKATERAPSRTVRPVPLPGAPAAGVFMDYLAYDRAHHRVWVPAGNTGSVDVCPNGGTPPIGNPVASRTTSASTREHFAPPAAAASFFSSSWFDPLT